MGPEHLELLRKLALGDEATLRSVVAGSSPHAELIDIRARGLVRVAASAGVSSQGASLAAAIDVARAAGVTDRTIEATISMVASMAHGTTERDADPGRAEAT